MFSYALSYFRTLVRTFELLTAMYSVKGREGKGLGKVFCSTVVLCG